MTRTDDSSTVRDVRRRARPRWGTVLRAAAVVALLVLVGAAATGMLGVRSATAEVEAGGFHVELTYPRIARAGLGVPFQLRVTARDQLPDPLTIGFATDYFGIFDSQGWSPQADTETADADMVYMTFAPPEGTVFTLDFDTYIEPGSQRGESGAVRVFDAAGRPAVDLSFTTWLVP